MIIKQSDFHSIPSVVLSIHHLESRFITGYFIIPRVTPLYFHYFDEPPICVAFDYTHVPYISDVLHIIRSVFKPQFIHYSKYAKYTFLLLFSIHVKISLAKEYNYYIIFNQFNEKNTCARGFLGHAPPGKMIKWCDLVHSECSKVC